MSGCLCFPTDELEVFAYLKEALISAGAIVSVNGCPGSDQYVIDTSHEYPLKRNRRVQSKVIE